MTEQRPQQTGGASRRSSPRRGSTLGHDSFPVVGLGASAGGLDAFRRLLAALPAGTGMAFILIQHLDPTHASMMVDLLAGHTPMKVAQAADGMALEPEHVYLIPPGAYLSIQSGALRLSKPREPSRPGDVHRACTLGRRKLQQTVASAIGRRSTCSKSTAKSLLKVETPVRRRQG